MMSITGHTTFRRSSFTRDSNGSNHPAEHSQCASKKVRTYEPKWTKNNKLIRIVLRATRSVAKDLIN